MKSSGSRAMKSSTLSILLMLCACCAWADEVLELQPRLAEAAGAQGQAYVELRDRLVSTVSTNALFAAVDDSRLEWRERLVARICCERITRLKEIEALRSHDWRQHPGHPHCCRASRRKCGYGYRGSWRAEVVSAIPY